MSASHRCSHGKQVPSGSHADSTEFCNAASESKFLHALQLCVGKCLVRVTPAYNINPLMTAWLSGVISKQKERVTFVDTGLLTKLKQRPLCKVHLTGYLHRKKHS